MQLDLLCVGKVKEPYLRDAIAEYVKRLAPYARLSIQEVRDEEAPDGISDAQRQKILAIEGERLSKRIAPDAVVHACAIEGQMPDSMGYAAEIGRLRDQGVQRLQYVIGGSYGLDEAIKARSDRLLSFSRMTFPHQLMRVILLEQLYRSFRILQGAPYHK